MTSLLWGVASMSLLVAAWQTLCSTIGRDLPTPLSTYHTLVTLLSDPFNPDRNSLGIGLQLWESLRQVLEQGFTRPTCVNESSAA